MSFCGLIAHFFIALSNIPLDIPQLIHSPIEGYLGCFQVLKIIKLLETKCAGFHVDIRFLLILASIKENNCWVLWYEYIWCCRNCQTFPKWLHHFLFLPAMNESSYCFMFLSAFGGVSVWISTILIGV